MQSTNNKKTQIAIIISYFLLALLFHVGISKLVDHKITVFEYNLSPDLRPASQALSIIVPAIEISIGILLFLKRTKAIGLIMSAVLFTIYLIALFTVNRYVPNIRGGLITTFSFNQYIFINGAFLAISVLSTILLLTSKRPTKRERKSHKAILDNELQNIIAQ
jgi:hypothetical protein